MSCSVVRLDKHGWLNYPRGRRFCRPFIWLLPWKCDKQSTIANFVWKVHPEATIPVLSEARWEKDGIFYLTHLKHKPQSTQFSYLLLELANIWENPNKAFLDKIFQVFSDRYEMLCKLRRFWPCKIWVLTNVKCSLRIT